MTPGNGHNSRLSFLDRAALLFGGSFEERLARLDETNRQVLNFSDQLQQLQDILKNPKFLEI